MAKHTPGPWKAYDDTDVLRRHEVISFGRTVTRIYATKGLEEEDSANARLIAAAPELLDVVEATLLFHSASPWTEEKCARWLELTGSGDATTKALCDFARAALSKAGTP